MKSETCMTCKEWDSSFCGQSQNVEGLCEITGDVTHNDYCCDKHKLKLIIRIKRWCYKIKSIFKSKYPDPLKYCEKAKNRECVHIDGFLCPCEEMNKNNLKEVNIILKNGKELHFIAKEKLPLDNNKVAIYKADDDTMYTIIIDEIAVVSEKKID